MTACHLGLQRDPTVSAKNSCTLFPLSVAPLESRTMTTDETEKFTRLRAAAALLPQIEAGLSDGKISREKAALGAEFCSWAVAEISDTDPAEDSKLAKSVREGLSRLEAALSD